MFAWAVLAVDGGGVRELRRGPRVTPRVLGPGRAALVPLQAGPLAGDHDAVRLHVGAGATLSVEPVAATVAYPGAARTRLDLDVVVEDGGRLILEDAPLIVAEGADVVRTTTIALGDGAVAAVKDVVVLGRAGEGPGRLHATLRATGPDGPILHDAFRVDPDTWAADAHVALAPGHRAIATVCLLGVPGNLEGPGSLWRGSAASAADAEAAVAGAWARVNHPNALRSGERAVSSVT
jgi:urease accessory protein